MIQILKIICYHYWSITLEVILIQVNLLIILCIISVYLKIPESE
jgi:hypothetical protein